MNSKASFFVTYVVTVLHYHKPLHTKCQSSVVISHMTHKYSMYTHMHVRTCAHTHIHTQIIEFVLKQQNVRHFISLNKHIHDKSINRCLGTLKNSCLFETQIIEDWTLADDSNVSLKVLLNPCRYIHMISLLLTCVSGFVWD